MRVRRKLISIFLIMSFLVTSIPYVHLEKAEAASTTINSFDINATEFYVGKTYTVTAIATSANRPLYRFWIGEWNNGTWIWTIIQDYSEKNTAIWTPTKPGLYRPNVHVRDSASTEPYDTYKYIDVTVNDPNSKYVTDYRTGSTSNFNSTITYSDSEGYTGVLTKDGSPYVISGSPADSQYISNWGGWYWKNYNFGYYKGYDIGGPNGWTRYYTWGAPGKVYYRNKNGRTVIEGPGSNMVWYYVETEKRRVDNTNTTERVYADLGPANGYSGTLSQTSFKAGTDFTWRYKGKPNNYLAKGTWAWYNTYSIASYYSGTISKPDTRVWRQNYSGIVTREVNSLSVSPSPVNIRKGETQQLKVTASYATGNSEEVTSKAIYSSSNTSVATVNNSGLVTGKGTGTTTIAVAYGSFTKYVSVSVSSGVTIEVSPDSVSLHEGETQRLTVRAYFFSSGTEFIVTNFASYSSNNTEVATVGNTSDVDKGLITGKKAGTATITVSYSGETLLVPVNISKPYTTSISVSPASVNIRRGDTKQLAVTALLSDGTSETVTSKATYSSSNTSVATVGTGGLVTGKAVGTATVTATYSGKSKQVTVNVRYPDVTSISASPASVNIRRGDTKQLAVTALLSDGTSETVTSKATYSSNLWAKGDPETFEGWALNGSSVSQCSTEIVTFEGRKCLKARIKDLYEGTAWRGVYIYQDYDVLVGEQYTASIEYYVEPGGKYCTGFPRINGERSFSGSVGCDLSKTGTWQRLEKTWTANANGTGRALWYFYSHTGAHDIEYTVYIYDPRIESSVAAVDATGLITGKAVGTTTVTVSYSGKTAPVIVNVRYPDVESISVVPDPVNIRRGDTQQLSVTALLSDGTTEDVTSKATYTTNLIENGDFTSGFTGWSKYITTNGNAEIVQDETYGNACKISGTSDHQWVCQVFDSAEHGTYRLSGDIKVLNHTSSSGLGIALWAYYTDGTATRASKTVDRTRIGEWQHAECTITTDPSKQIKNITAYGPWSNNLNGSFMGTNIHLEKSSVNNVVMVDTAGKITGNAIGSAKIVTTYEGKSAYVDVEVREPDVVSITVISQNGNILRKGGTLQLETTAFMSDKTYRVVTDKVSYSSSNPLAATVNNTGIVAGIAEGKTTVTAEYNNKSASIDIEVLPRLYVYIRTLY